MNGAKSQGWPPTAGEEAGDITLARPRGPAGSGAMAKTRSSLAADMARGCAGLLPAQPIVKRNAPGHFDSGGRVEVRFSNDDEMRAIIAAIASVPPMIRVRIVDRFTGLPVYQQRRMTDHQIRAMKALDDALADQAAQDQVEGRK